MSEDMNQKGLEIRREVLGQKYVDASIEASRELEFGMPLQELVNKYCWGEVWGRPGLSRKTRSMLNIAMISALNRPNEVKIHLAAALRHGCGEEEILEIILQIAIYCGVPAAMVTYNLAKEVIAEHRAAG